MSLLQRRAPMPVSWAEQGERIRPNHAYVAPPDVHLTLTDDHLQLTRAPRELHAAVDRPSVSIAVVLTGMMDDGVAGALAIQLAGGRVIVQDPRDAEFPELPSRAITAFVPDATLPLERIADAIVAMTREVVTVPVRATE